MTTVGGRTAGIGLLLLAAASACDVPHDYQRAEFSGTGLSGTAPLEVVVRFPAGGISMHAGTGRLLYRAFVTHCEQHSETTAELIQPVEGRPGRLSLSLVGKPGVFVGFGGERNHMDLSLSPEPAILLDVDLGEGESVLDMAGLRLHRMKLSAGAGDTRVVFGSPNTESPEEITINQPIGDLSIDWLGNANAGRVDVQGGVGALEIDLGGQWRRDAAVTIRGSVGDVILRLPTVGPGIRLEAGSPWGDNLNVPGMTRRGEALYSDGYDTAAPRLDVRIEAGIGALIVELAS